MSLADYKKSKESITGHKIETKELLGKTLTLLSMIPKSTKNGECILVRFKEDPEGYYFGGSTTVKLYNDFKTFDVDITKENVKVKYTEEESKNGRKYIMVNEVTEL